MRRVFVFDTLSSLLPATNFARRIAASSLFTKSQFDRFFVH
jgi:hypothetical protein